MFILKLSNNYQITIDLFSHHTDAAVYWLFSFSGYHNKVSVIHELLIPARSVHEETSLIQRQRWAVAVMAPPSDLVRK